MSVRPTRSKATQTEVNRVASISQQELAETSAFATVNPRTIPEVKVWLRVDLASDSGTLTIPDSMGGASATEVNALQKPVVGVTGNGLAKLTCNRASRLVLPVSAGINDANYFGMGLWVRPANVSTSDDIFTIETGTGASANRIRFGQSTNRLVNLVYATGSDNRVTQSNTTRAYFATNVWKFIGVEFDGSQALEANRCRLRDMGSPLAQPMDEVYSSFPVDEVAVPPPGPATLNVVTGTAWLFQRRVAFDRGFNGDVGPDIFFYDPRTMTQEKLIQLAQFRVPVG